MRIPLVMSYDNESAIDGFGAQAIRLCGIYAIASATNCHYSHNPIVNVPRDELSRFSVSDEEYQKCLRLFNQILAFDSTIQIQNLEKVRLCKENSIWLRKLLKYTFSSLLTQERLNLNLTLPQGITDKLPFLLEKVAFKLQQNLGNLGEDRSARSTVLHIRAEHHGPNKRRPHLSPEYYTACVDELIKQRNIESLETLIVHTDFFDEDFASKNLQWRPSLFVKLFEDLEKTFSEVRFRHYAPIEDVLVDLFYANTLIMSRSSISYFAGIVNQNRVIWPPSHGHAKLPRWLTGPNLKDRGLFIGGMKSREED